MSDNFHDDTKHRMDDRKRKRRTHCLNSLFEECFAPLAHHILPDGWGTFNTSTSRGTRKNNHQEAFDKLVSLAWPKHKTDRRTVPSKNAIASIQKLRDYSQQYGLNTTQIAAVIFVSCRLLQPQWNNTCTSGSQLVRSSHYFAELIRCILPRKIICKDCSIDSDESSINDNNNNDGEMVSFPTGGISLLLSAVTVVDLRDDANDNHDNFSNRDCQCVLRLLTLWVRLHHHPNNSPDNDLLRAIPNYYSVLFAMLSVPSIQLDAVRLLYIITRKRHAKSFRARRLRFLYDQHFTDTSEEDVSSTTNSSCKSKNHSTTVSVSSSSTRKKIISGSSPIYLLMKLYSHYNPEGCGKYLPKKSKYSRIRMNQYSKYLNFPDEAWEKDFHRVITSTPIDENNHNAYPSTNHKSKQKFNGNENKDISYLNTIAQNDNSINYQIHNDQEKYRKMDLHSLSSGRHKLSDMVKKVDDLLDGVRSSSWQLLSGNISTNIHNVIDHSEQNNFNNRHYYRKALRASDLLMDQEIRFCLSLSSSKNIDKMSRTMNAEKERTYELDALNSNDICQSEIARLRVCLPFMLREEWYDKEEDEETSDEINFDKKEIVEISGNENNVEGITRSFHKINNGDSSLSVAAIHQKSTLCPGIRKSTNKRLGLIKALASLAQDIDMLPPEAEDFVVDEILPSWDGSDDMGGIILCNDLLAVLSPRSFRELNRSVLIHLLNLYIGGSVRLKNSIVSGTLSSLIRRWGSLSISKWDRSSKLSKTLKELIHWTDSLLLSGSISEVDDNNNGHELIRHSVLNFFNAVCDVSDQCNFIILPSPSLMNRMLLSNTVVCIDRTCTLFLRYKDIFVAAKQKNEEIKKKIISSSEESLDKDPVVPGTTIYGIERVAIFNCFIWDFCSALWRSSSLLPDDETARDAIIGIRSKSLLFNDLSPYTLPAIHRLRDQYDFSTCLSITKNAAFSGFASDFLDSLTHNEKLQLMSRNNKFDGSNELSNEMITGTWKIKYLEYLKKIGFHGLYTFLTTFVGILSKHERRKLVRNNK